MDNYIYFQPDKLITNINNQLNTINNFIKIINKNEFN